MFMVCPVCKEEKEILNKEKGKDRVTYLFSCGHKLITLELFDEIQSYDILQLKKKGEKNFSKEHKWEQEIVIGDRVGKDRKPAYVHQVINRAKNYYKKFVRQGDVVLKDVEEKLSGHR